MRILPATPIVLLLAACSTSESGNAATDTAAAENATAAPAADGAPFAVTPVATFDSPWAITFLPDRRMLVTEKAGRLLLVTADGQGKTTVAGTPTVFSGGQGGLMDVVPHPQFAQNRIVYLSWSEEGPGGQGVALGRGRLVEEGGEARLDGFETIFRQTPFVSGTRGHFSGRIAFSPDGRYLFFTNGDRQKFDPAQDPKATMGKVLRLTLDGKPAPGNPLAAKGFHPAVWSYGHRNLLGIAFDGAGNLWEQEMGPKGGDELNLVLPGRNYGWPKASNGDHYDGPPRNGEAIPDHRAGDGFEPPKVWWTPVISPGGLIVYSGDLFPQWKGDAFIGGLSSKSLVRVDIDGTNARKGDQWDMGKRIRDVEQGPDGALYLLEDESGGRLLRLTPKA